MTFSSPAAAACVLAASALLGLVMGGFVNCWAWRSVHGGPAASCRPHCASCGHALGMRDFAPIVSWLPSKGRCRYCGEKAGVRYPLAEGACATAFVAVTAVYGLTAETAELLAFACILLYCSLVDIDKRIIPDGSIVAAVGVRALYLAVAVAAGWAVLEEIAYYVASAFGLGAAMLAVVFAADRAFGRESMGGGDLKLYAVASLYFGWQKGILVVIVSCVLGAACALVSARASGQGPVLGRTFPFGPSIAVACIVVMAVGEPAVLWYLGSM